MAPPRRKGTITAYSYLDVRDLARVGALRPGVLSSCQLAAFYALDGALRLSYSVKWGDTWEPVEQTVRIASVPRHYGGSWALFVCPCGRRAVRLYAGRRYLCRTCQDLAYPSQREGQSDRTRRKLRKFRRKLGGSDNLIERFPVERPRYMHRSTHKRLFDKWVALEEAYWGGMLEQLHRARAGRQR